MISRVRLIILMARSKYRLVNGILEIDESLNRIQIDDFFGHYESAACSDAVFNACSIAPMFAKICSFQNLKLRIFILRLRLAKFCRDFRSGIKFLEAI